MALSESSVTKQVEIAFIQGVPAYAFRETENQILKDGVVVASTPHRESYPIDSDEARAVFGDAQAAAIAGTVGLQAQVDALSDLLVQAQAQLQAKDKAIAELQAQLQAATSGA